MTKENNRNISIGITAALCFLVIISTVIPVKSADKNNVRLGILAKRGKQQCSREWAPTAEYLTRRLKGHSFVILPLAYDEVIPAVKERKVDFILATPNLYIELENYTGAFRIVTLKPATPESSYTRFGSVIFCSSSNINIKNIRDLKGSSFTAVDPKSMGGWIMALRRLKTFGLDAGSFSSLDFAGTHDKAVYSVLSGRSDAGTVRTGILEKMANEGKIEASSFRVIAPVSSPDFHYARSTALYPEWPLACVSGTCDDLARNVASALMQIRPGSRAAHSAGYNSWTVPLNYRGVRDCLMELRMPPYENYGKVTVRQFIVQHWYWVLSLFILIAAMAYVIFYIYKLNKDLRTKINRIKTLEGLLPICSSCKKVRDDTGYWLQIEEYLNMHSDAEFSHSLCPECAEKMYPGSSGKVVKFGPPK